MLFIDQVDMENDCQQFIYQPWCRPPQSLHACLQDTLAKLHSQLAAAAAAKEAANEARAAAELKHGNEAANRAVLEGSLERAHSDLSHATQER